MLRQELVLPVLVHPLLKGRLGGLPLHAVGVVHDDTVTVRDLDGARGVSADADLQALKMTPGECFCSHASMVSADACVDVITWPGQHQRAALATGGSC